MRYILLRPLCTLCLVCGCASNEGVSSKSGDTRGQPSGGAGTGGGSSAPSTGGTAPVITPPAPIDCDRTLPNTLPVTYRDFQASHPDFEESFAGDVVRRGLVDANLGIDSKPVFVSTTGCPWEEASPLNCANWGVTEPEITSQETFDQWYRDVTDVNLSFEKELVLTEEMAGSGSFVFDSAAFFPLGPGEGYGATPPEHIGQNFFFTTEIHLQFVYGSGQRFTFRGDDDLWIFVNKQLALDLGGLHGPAEGTIDFDAQAASLDIQPGRTYAMDIFHAERHTTGSNFRIETNIDCFTPGVIR